MCPSPEAVEQQDEGSSNIQVEDDHAMETTRGLIARGFPVGPSSGLNFHAASLVADRHGTRDLQVVTVFPDRMERYFTTELFQPFASGDGVSASDGGR